jgi:hypothetical protein
MELGANREALNTFEKIFQEQKEILGFIFIFIFIFINFLFICNEVQTKIKITP